MNDPIIINVYDRAWPMLFETEKKLLLPVIAGAAIEHIGSTAVEGLWAKPVIDIMIGISDDEELDRLIPSIEKLGYSYHPEFEHEMPERRYFRKEKNGIRTHQIHLVRKSSSFWFAHIFFRDKLRSDRSLAERYSALKIELAARYTNDREAYTNAKTPFIMNVLKEEPRKEVRRLALASMARGENTGWFEELYHSAAGDYSKIPWADRVPNPFLVDWLLEAKPDGKGKRALVVGCGLGDDAEEIARYGFQVTAFDLSPTAIEWAKNRFPMSSVEYFTADLFDLPVEWKNHFDLVFESYTIQAIPPTVRAAAIEAVRSLIAPKGSIVIVARVGQSTRLEDGPPWSLTDNDFDAFGEGMKPIDKKDFIENEDRSARKRCIFQRI